MSMQSFAKVSSSPLPDYIFAAKYGRYDEDLGRREVFEEAVDRVIDMHRVKYQHVDLTEELEFCREAMKDKLVLGSQRALQFGGLPILKKNARLYNCCVSYCDRPRFFQEAFWLLLCGAGAGFSVQTHHVAKLPHVTNPSGSLATYVVPDTIEGWSDSLGVLLASYGLLDQSMKEFARFQGTTVVFDYSEVRPAGSAIGSGSGKAPGPGPLRNAHEKIRYLLDAVCAENLDGTVALRPIHVYDVLMHASDAVISGGVRRSATICIFTPTDEEMLLAKTGDWFLKNPQRGRSNNSALLLRDSTTWEEFDTLIQRTKEFGEPGFLWADSTEIVYNPCVEIGMYPQIRGISGWAFCNLCETNAKVCNSDLSKWERAITAAAILGTLQAGYTDFEYLTSASKEIAEREALLGVSMTGMMDNPKYAFDPQIQRAHARLILQVNEKLAKKIGINPTARATCVKPAGTTSCLLETASGIHAHHAKRYFRRAQANVLEEPLRFYKEHNPRAVERSVWSANDTDMVVTFCIETDDEALTKGDVSAIKLLEYVKLTQQNWVAAGRVPERCAQPWLTHNVSNTINVRQEEWDDVGRFIYGNRQWFAGIALLSHEGDLDYPQAPFCSVKDEAELLAAYGPGVFLASGLVVDGLDAFADNLWAACDCALGIGEKLEDFKAPSGVPHEVRLAYARVLEEKKDWIRRIQQFADRYFEGNLKRTTYALKDVSNYKLWLDLHREHVSVDWANLAEAEDNTNLAADPACAGGVCSVSYA